MAILARARPIGSRIGLYFLIFTSAVIGLSLLLLVLEELGTEARVITRSMLLAPILLYVAIAAVGYAGGASTFLTADRQVPAALGGLSSATAGLGCIGFAGFGGLLFHGGAGGLLPLMGILLGLLAALVLVAPYLRKDGAPTLPGFVARRFRSAPVRIALALATAVPALIVVLAEVKIGATLASGMLGISVLAAALAGGTVAGLTLGLGGMRAAMGTGAAQGIVALLGLLVPLALTALFVSNIPIPQLLYGTLLDDLAQLEASNGFAAAAAPLFGLALPPMDLRALTTPFLAGTSGIGSGAGVALVLTIAFGMAVNPAIAMRIGAAPSVYDARRSIGWMIFIVAGVALTLPALAVYTRYLVLSDIAAKTIDLAPAWLDRLAELGLARSEQAGSALDVGRIGFTRDGVSVLLPVVAGYPRVLAELASAGLIAAALAAVTAGLLTIATTASEDLVLAWQEPGESERGRLLVGRGAVAVLALPIAWLANEVGADPLMLFFWGVALAAAGLFPVVVLSIWWKRLNGPGALAGILAGFGLGLLLFVAALAGAPTAVAGVDGLLLAPLAVAAGFAAAVAVALASPAPSQEALEIVRDIRIPGGETVEDRSIRLSRIGKRRAP